VGISRIESHQESFPLVSIVIPTRNRIRKLIRLIRSIKAGYYPTLEIIVVDDCSSDRTPDIVEDSFPEIRVIRSENRRLLAVARNKGIQSAKGEFVLVIDDDNIVDPDAISHMVRYLQRTNRVGIVGPLTLYQDDPNRIMFAGVRRSMITSKTRFVGKDEINVGQYKTPLESLDLPNAFMIKRRVIEEIGQFNEVDFPIDYDEADFGERVRKVGYKIMILPFSKVYHQRLSSRSDASTSDIRVYYKMRSRIRFHRKYSMRLHFVAFAFLFLPFFLLYALLTSKVYPSLKGLIDGIADRHTFEIKD